MEQDNNINLNDWKTYMGIKEEMEEIVADDDVEGEWEDVRKL